jgi:branched-chain amino acid transport system ATP-binding protein
MLRVTELTTGYGENKVLFGVSVEINQGEIAGLVGSNAAGKTTLLHTISGVNKVWAGKIEFMGQDITKMSPQYRTEMGLIQCPEGRKLFPTLNVLENLLIGAYPKRAKKNKDKTLKHVYEMFPILEERKYQPAGLLSGGEQQMCAIARALMSDPALLIMDEPSLGLAPIIVQKVFEIIEQINKDGVTIFLVEQNVRKALTLAANAYAMENGRITMHMTGQELLQNENLRKTYLGI